MNDRTTVKRGAPDGRGRHLRRRLVLGTALATSAFFGGYRGYIRRAFADCTGAGGTYTCSGYTTSTQTLNGTPLTVTTDDTFSIDTTASGGTAFTLTGNGGLTFTDNNKATIAGSYYGINAGNDGGGALSITTTGTVTGLAGGIFAFNSGTDLVIGAYDVRGASDGIHATNLGSGVLSITATGTVTGTNVEGIEARAGSNTTGLTISVVDVSGGAGGIEASNSGSGALSITASGTVEGRFGNGINVDNISGSHTTDLMISVSDVSGGGYGIVASNSGTGKLAITASGTVTGSGNAGISARNSGTDLTISAAKVSGGYYGIKAINGGSGALSIAATGAVTGTSSGIFASNVNGTGLTIEAYGGVSGGSHGIFVNNYGSGALSITATGAVTGSTGDGIYASTVDGTDLTISAAKVSGGYYGIKAINGGSGALSIAATGAVTGSTGDGIYAQTGNYGTSLTIEAYGGVSGASDGIRATNYGSGKLAITTSGAVTGTTGAGIYALNGTYTANSGTDLTISTADVSGGTDGIVALNYGSGALSVTANGTVTGGSGSGIRARNDGSDTLTITATGTVTGTGAYGIEAVTHGTGLTIDAVAVSGAGGGIAAQNVGSGVLKITTTGMVEGGSGTGIAASTNSPTNSVVIEATDVSGGTGIDVYAWSGGAVSITATGTVTGTDGNGIWASGGTDVTVRANTVHGSENGISAINNGGLGPLTISATGTVTGGADGILARSFGTGLTISTAAVHGGHHGIEARNYIGDPLAITASGTVTGGAGYDGIFAFNDSGTDLTIDVAGVSGGDSGIHASNRYGSGVLRITASGTVTGTGNDGIYARSDGTDLTIDVADVSGGKNGINAHGNGTGALSIVAGAVTGGSGGGIYALNNRGTDLTISAVDVSGGTFGVNAVNDGSGALSITASGTVEGTSINGIIARNTGADLTIAAAAVSGERYGIGANNAGSGALSITATGAVTGANQDGIIAINFGSALTIAAAAVSGGNNGILARNFGSGALSITATGMVTGTGGDGIYVSNFDSGTTDLTIDMADVSGGKNGINAVNYGSGVLAITTSGTVTGGSGSGIAAVNNSASADSTTTVTVEDSSAVSGGAVGVGLLSTTGRAASLANAGSITGATGVVVSGGPATLSNTGAITGIGGPAIDLTGAGGVSTVNQKGGTITGAILLSAAADTINITGGAIAGSIVGQGSAVTNFALGSGSFSFAAPYAITGMAAVAMNSGTVAIAGTIDTDVLAVNGGTMTVAGAVNTPAFELNGGTLSVSSDANLGSGAGTLTFDGGTFESTAAFATARAVTLNAGGGTFRTDADLTVASGITGSGGLTKTGTAALTLNGVNSFTGLTTINEGKLVVGDDAHARASLAGAVMVNSGGTLGGMGTVGSTTVASGGTIAPGNSIGTLTVKGDISFAAGSTYVAEINPALDSDLIAASGKATIDGGTVYAAKVAGVYTPGSRWTILGADGGVAGTFDALDQNMPFVALALAYDADHVYIDATRNSTAFCMAGMTFNQCSTGNGLESTGVGNPVYDAVAALPDEGAARRALDSLSGEIYASAKSALIEDSHFVRDAVNDRIRSAFGDATMGDMPVLAYGPEGAMPASPGEGLGVAGWGRAFGSWGSFDGNGNAAAMDTSTGGFIAGIDGAITSDIRLGFLAGYSHSSFDVGGRSSSGSSDNYHLGLYAGGKWNALRLTGGLAYTWHDIGTNRSVVFPGFRDSLTGDYHAGTFQVFGEAGYRINMGTVAFEPFANLAYVNLHTDGFTEDGGAAALHVRGDTTETTFTTLGIHLSSAFMVGGMRATAHGTLGWRHAFGDITPLSTHAFAGGDPFAIAGVPIAKDAAVIDAGLDLDLTKAATFGVAYQGQFGSGAIQNGFKADLTVRF